MTINISMTLIIIALTAGLTLTVGRRIARSRPVLAIIVCGSAVPLLQVADGIMMFVNRPQLPPPFDTTLPSFDVTAMMLRVMVIGTITTALVTFLTSTLIIVASTVRRRRS